MLCMKKETMKKREKREKYITTRTERNVMWFDGRRIAHERKTEQDDERPELRSILDGKSEESTSSN